MLIVLLAMLALSACGDDDNDNGLTEIPDINPENFDWDIYILDIAGDDREDYYYVTCDWLGNEDAITEQDQFSIQFNDAEPIILSGWGWFGEWSFSAEAFLSPGTNYNVKLLKNSVQVTSGNIKTAYRAYGNFPSYYNPTTTAELSWTLSDNNQYQVAGVSSYSEDYEDYDDAMEDLDPSDRTYTIPANAVQHFGDYTEYELLIMEMNFTQNGRTAFMAVQGSSNYYESIPAKDVAQNLLTHARKLRKQM